LSRLDAWKKNLSYQEQYTIIWKSKNSQKPSDLNKKEADFQGNDQSQTMQRAERTARKRFNLSRVVKMDDTTFCVKQRRSRRQVGQ